MLRKRLKARALIAALLSVLTLTGMLVVGPGGGTPAQAQQVEHLPIIFVHGYLGSGAQYRSQAQRFASNGWPAERISALDYSGLAPPNLNAYIDSVRQRFGVDRVYVAAHSLGTAVMAGYLGNASQAAKVAAYAALDGVGASCPSGTRCTSISAASMGQSHVEAAVSAESFRRQYQHFTGQAPQTTNITPQEDIQISGKALEFSNNVPVAGVTQGRVYEVNPDSGLRVGWPNGQPAATFDIRSDGSFGPVSGLKGSKTYEIAISNSQSNGTIHFYQQPFIRSSHILRLQLATTSSPSYTNANRGPNHSLAVVVRYREWWAGNAAARDNLNIQTYSWSGIQAPVNALSRLTSNTIAGIHVHDDAASPRQSTLNGLPYFSTQAFQTGVDVYMPASPAGPNGIIRFENNPRGDANRKQTINALNWPSEGQDGTHGIIVEFNDFVQ
jgi:pimeloyl-ACP methyl ester carboxylesterase